MEQAEQTLDTLLLGRKAIIRRLTSTGLERRRMMDLGLLPGSIVQVEMRSPLGDPTAYQIRGALVALRKSQAQQIIVEEVIKHEAHKDNVSKGSAA